MKTKNQLKNNSGLCKKIKTNDKVKRIVNSGNNNESLVVHEDTDLDLQEAETEGMVDDFGN